MRDILIFKLKYNFTELIIYKRKINKLQIIIKIIQNFNIPLFFQFYFSIFKK